MPAIALPPEGALSRGRRGLQSWVALGRRFGVELLWAVFAAANYAVDAWHEITRSEKTADAPGQLIAA